MKILLFSKSRGGGRLAAFSSAFTLAEGAAQICHFDNICRAAFTLAEVLITLGIIGVVAAMTIPVLFANYQKMVLKNQFKKAYSTVYQGIRLVEANMGYKPECYGWDTSPYASGLLYCTNYDDAGNCTNWGNNEGKPVPSDYNGRMGECTEFWKQFEKSVKILKICENKAYPECIPEYNGIDSIKKAQDDSLSDEDLNKETTGSSWWRKSAILNDRKAYVLADGTIMLFKGSWPGNIGFAIDVNGKKRPNKWGYDIFDFSIVSTDSSALKLKGGSLMIEEGGTSAASMIKNMGQ